jgi:predicted outer membrane protein
MRPSSAIKFGIVTVMFLGALGGDVVGQKWRQSGPFAMRPGEPEPNNRIDATNPVGAARVVPHQTTPASSISPVEQRQAIERFQANALLAKSADEIQFCQYAVEHAKADQVRQFALQMIDEHRELSRRLERLVPPVADSSIAAPRAGQVSQNKAASDANLPLAAPSQAPAVEPALAAPAPEPMHLDATQDLRPRPPASSDASAVASRGLWNARRGSDVANGIVEQLSAIDRRIESGETKMMRELIEQKSGTEFDEAFMSAETSGLIETITDLEVVQQEAVGPLRQIAQQSLPNAERHLQLAQRMMQERQRVAEGTFDSNHR